jgi:cation diffusion facilitator CzcD-associated flavoprotein CzcO
VESTLDPKTTITLYIQYAMAIKSVAIIGAGPAGAIAVDALAQEKAFDVIRVFDRQEKAGGCW